MGTRMAPNYAIIFMHYLETNFLITLPKATKDLAKIHWWKNHDMVIWKIRVRRNEIHLHYWSTVYRSHTNRLYTWIYHKPTDQKHYLHYYSAHPRNQKNSVHYGLSLDVKEYAQRNINLNKKPEKYTTN